MRSYCGILAVALLATITPTSVSAQTVSRLGPSMTAISGVARGSNVAYDFRDSVYLVVSAHGGINGVFVTADGGLGTPFALAAAGTFNQFPIV